MSAAAGSKQWDYLEQIDNSFNYKSKLQFI